MSRRYHFQIPVLAALALGPIACQSTTPDLDPDGDAVKDGEQIPGIPIAGDQATSFISDVPGQSAGADETATADSGSAAPAAAGAEAGSREAAERAIAEADILQVEGERLYALSRYSGLSVIDVSDPGHLTMEGSYRSAATPFEMYVEQGQILAMFNDFSRYECDDDNGCRWEQTSRLEAIDASNPKNIEVRGDYDIPGSISDSRLVGDVLYIATHENGYCWGCDRRPNTAITSFNVNDVQNVEQVDQLRFAGEKDSYYGQRSISVTTERIYISGEDWNWQEEQGGEIQVVDISNPGGDLVAGAKIEVAGPIQSRWQMDEFEGVLRVISQPGGFRTQDPPLVETFRVESASHFTKLASLALKLPRPEDLRSVRFDGDRAYAITFERTDPLFTLDLSDPAAPEQAGMLEIPGWVYHMEPRGDRVIALGFDNGNENGSLNVSLFDVSNLKEPSMLARSHFGGDWGSFAEDQDRIHKAFTILPDQELILVPFSGGSHDEETCEYSYGSGIQLIDFKGDTLTARGVAPQRGNARRALIHRGHLFGIGDNAVQTFDITDRDHPVEKGKLEVARNIGTVRVIGDRLMRFGSDWWTDQTTLEMTSLARADEVVPDADIELSALFGENARTCNGSQHWGGQVFTKDGYAYVPRYTTEWGRDYQSRTQALTLYVIDLNGETPKALGKLEVPTLTGEGYFAGITQTESTLLVGRSTGYNYYRDQESEKPRFYYEVIDLRTPEAPVLTTTFEIPHNIAGYGWGHLPGGCGVDMDWGWGFGYYGQASAALVDGDVVASQHNEPVDDGTGRVRYYLDRIDVSDPESPQVLQKVNIPGHLLHFKADEGELVTLDYHAEVKDVPEDKCRGEGFYTRHLYDDESGKPSEVLCVAYRRSLNSLQLEGDSAVRLSQILLDVRRQAGNIAVSDLRVFYTTRAWSEDYGAPSELTMETLRFEDGRLYALPSLSLDNTPTWFWSQIRARGERAFVSTTAALHVIETQDGTPSTKMYGIPGWGCADLEVSGDTAYCALGRRGVEVIDLTQAGQ